MSLKNKINDQLNVALKNKNKSLVSTLRLILAAIKDREIASRSKDKKENIKDPEIINLLKKMKKQRQDSADLYKKGERKELLDVELEEIKVVDSFLPAQLNEEQIKKICIDTIKAVGATNIKDMGKIMGVLKKSYADVIDFSKVNLIVKSILEK